jgi:hypothetical protein
MLLPTVKSNGVRQGTDTHDGCRQLAETFMIKSKGRACKIKPGTIYRVIQKDGLNFVRIYFLICTAYVNDLHNI